MRKDQILDSNVLIAKNNGCVIKVNGLKKNIAEWFMLSRALFCINCKLHTVYVNYVQTMLIVNCALRAFCRVLVE